MMLKKNGLRSVLVGFGAIALAATVATGCAPQGDNSEAGGKTTITWWLWDTNPDADAMVEAFEEQNPNITVEQKTYNNADYLNAIRPGLTSSSGPDVFQVAPGGMLTNYGPLAMDLTDYAKSSLGDDWKDKFNSTAIDQLTHDGSQVALPTYMSAAGYVYYNQKLIDELGIAVPTTVPEWAETCKTVTAAGYTCLAQGAKDAWASTDVFMSLANSADPGYIYEAIDGKSPWTSANMLTAMTAWQSLFTDGIAGKGATAQSEYPDAFNEFLESKAVFIALGTWNTPGTQTKTGVAISQKGLDRTIDGIFLSAPFPGATADSEPTKPFGGVSNGWAINSRSKNADAAFKLVQFLSAGKGQEMIGSVASFPALKTAKASTDDVIDPSQVENIETLGSSLDNLIGIRELPYPDLSAAIGQELSAVAAGTQTPESALEAIQIASDAIKR